MKASEGGVNRRILWFSVTVATDAMPALSGRKCASTLQSGCIMYINQGGTAGKCLSLFQG
ncbi:MAG: hypothetical protein ACOX4P_07035 [Anaerovoracaceae bacterium]